MEIDAEEEEEVAFQQLNDSNNNSGPSQPAFVASATTATLAKQSDGVYFSQGERVVVLGRDADGGKSYRTAIITLVRGFVSLLVLCCVALMALAVSDRNFQLAVVCVRCVWCLSTDG